METLIRDIRQQDFDLAKYVQIVLENHEVRDVVINGMLSNPDIMVYYHCFYIIDKASREVPEIFYPYWERFADLLTHGNSYHRDFGLILLANIACVDQQDMFEKTASQYLSLFNDPKFMTAQCFIKNIVRIAICKKAYIEELVSMFLNYEEYCHYPPKQKALLAYDILCFFEVVQRESADERIQTFIEREQSSISPKTRKKAKQLISSLW